MLFSNLIKTIDRVKARLDEIVDQKKQYIPRLMRDTIHTSGDQGLFSNLYHLIDLEKCDKDMNSPKQLIDLYTFARYKYERFISRDRKTVLHNL